MVETSIIIRTYNEEKHLPRLFDALERQHYRDFENIVVDSGSLDRSREIAEARHAELHRIGKHDFTFGYSLNVGIRASKGKFIVMVSAHTEPVDPDWLENLIAPLRDENVAMSYGRQLGVPESKFGEAEDFLRIFGPDSLAMRPPKFFANNANSAVKRELWEKYPFDEKLTGLEDIDFAKYWMERGYQVQYQANAGIYHIHEETWPQVHRRYFREAVAARRIGIKGRRNIPGEIVREIAWTAWDFLRAFNPTNNPVSRRLNLSQRLYEISLFRSHKMMGTVQGLLEPHPMETRAEAEEYLFDRGAEGVVISGPGKAALSPVDFPEVKPGDVLIRVSHVAVCATDLELFAGNLGYYKSGMASYPIVPGHEFSGRVAAVGQNVEGFTEGDPVVAECIQSCGACTSCKSGNFIGCADRTELGVMGRNGAYARYVVVPAPFVHRLPNDVDLRKAALVEPIAVTLKGLRRMEPMVSRDTSKRRAAVVGAGPLGNIVAKVLQVKRFQVTAFDRSPERLEFLKGAGIEGSTDLETLDQFDVVVEVSGNRDALDTVLRNSAAGATILLIGLPYGEKSFSFETIAAYDKAVVGTVGSTKEDFEAAIEILPKLDLSAHTIHRRPLNEFSEAWDDSKKPDVLKVIIDVYPDDPDAQKIDKAA